MVKLHINILAALSGRNSHCVLHLYTALAYNLTKFSFYHRIKGYQSANLGGKSLEKPHDSKDTSHRKEEDQYRTDTALCKTEFSADFPAGNPPGCREYSECQNPPQ
ncbi:hypothetical protein K030075H31_53250 [Blautia producta]